MDPLKHSDKDGHYDIACANPTNASTQKCKTYACTQGRDCISLTDTDQVRIDQGELQMRKEDLSEPCAQRVTAQGSVWKFEDESTLWCVYKP